MSNLTIDTVFYGLEELTDYEMHQFNDVLISISGKGLHDFPEDWTDAGRSNNYNKKGYLIRSNGMNSTWFGNGKYTGSEIGPRYVHVKTIINPIWCE